MSLKLFAAKDLEQAVKLSPFNPLAYYYLELINLAEKVLPRQNQPDASMTQDRISLSPVMNWPVPI